MFAILETDIYGDIPTSTDDQCYLNHAYLHSMAFGSLDMAWTTNSLLEAEGMAARFTDKNYRHHKIVEVF